MYKAKIVHVWVIIIIRLLCNNKNTEVQNAQRWISDAYSIWAYVDDLGRAKVKTSYNSAKKAF